MKKRSMKAILMAICVTAIAGAFGGVPIRGETGLTEYDEDAIKEQKEQMYEEIKASDDELTKIVIKLEELYYQIREASEHKITVAKLYEQIQNTKIAVACPDKTELYLRQNNFGNVHGIDCIKLMNSSDWSICSMGYQTVSKILEEHENNLMNQWMSLYTNTDFYSDGSSLLYESYLRGAHSEINRSAELLAQIARGGSLFSTEGMTETNLPPIALSAFVGMGAGVLLMGAAGKGRKKEKEA